ncbi:Acetylglucosaminyltransferase EXT1/exostosin 1 [Handroanthus impetiginosus]|uniref:Acetylglucosaminyltransferase EXT1/exostosin 1 n=1 Tax=Handroanthus impetiginosus TaxID=429701 RepID=A0A2G9HIT3_9LAMI|nr:Acetylglucosaminyltransferase EXT1/exostosin 1 [Handroanthus impetiginosus]
MLPSSNPSPQVADSHHHSPEKSKKLELKTTLHSLKSHISAHRCAWLTATVFLQLLIILFLNRASSPPSLPSTHRPKFESDIATHRHNFKSGAVATPMYDESCKFGRIYMYDLPTMLNKDLLDNCHNLDLWSSRCNAVSNGGFGPPATGLDGIIPVNLTLAWYWTDMYIAEVIYHDRMMNYKCRTLNQNQAIAFYIPFYVGLAVGKYLWFNHTSKDRDYHSEVMLNWVKDQPPWKTSNGSDHFIMLGRLTWDFRRLSDNDNEWGTKFIYMPLMKNVLRLTVERSRWDELEISVPYPTAFHPRSESDIRQWQNLIRLKNRPNHLSFVGATRKEIKNDFRGVLMNYCKSESSFCKIVDCSITQCYDGAPSILEAFLDSNFCLQPKGDGFTRRSAFDCMLAGAIPVFFWRGSFEHQYQWHLPKSAETYSVFIDHKDVRNDTTIIRRVLEKYSRQEIEKMRNTIIDFLPRLLYSRSNADLGSIEDAFDIAMEGVLRRFKRQKMAAGGQRLE